MLDPARRSDPGSLFPWERLRTAVLDARGDVMPDLVAGAAELVTEAVEMEAVMSPAAFCMTV